MTKKKLLTFLNDASHENLMDLPRIGTSIADSIIAKRPFETLEEAEEINGISTNLLEELKNALPEETEEIPNSVEEPTPQAEENETSEVEAPPERFEIIPPNKPKQEKHGSFWREIFSGVIGALVATFLTLAILAGINGSLKYLTNSDAQALERKAEQLAVQADTLKDELDGVRSRVGTLEGLGDRTIALENEQEALKEELATANKELETMQNEIATLTQEIDEQNVIIARQSEEIGLFDNFFESLETLLSETFAPQTELSTDVETEENQVEEELTEGVE